MAETQLDVRGVLKPDAYRALKEQLEAVCEGVTDPIAVMATMACILHNGFGHLWTGFYRRIGPTRLIVGPYQGTLGCMEIEFGRGVCGTAALTRRTVIVPDVRLFAGHIACDARSLRRSSCRYSTRAVMSWRCSISTQRPRTRSTTKTEGSSSRWSRALQ